MNLPTYARRAARLLRQVAEPGYVPSAAARARSLSTIERALVARQRRTRRMWLGGSVAAAAIFMLGVGLAWRGAPPTRAPVSFSVTADGSGAWVTNALGSQALTGTSELAAGSRVTTSAGGSAVLQGSTGTRLALKNEGSLTVASVGNTQWFRLAEGALDARVAKLGPGERFVIETLDAKVEVRGTAFRVSVLDREAACEGGGRTRVRVSEGVVNVRSRGRAIDVRAGANWPADCDSTPRPAARLERAPEPKGATDAVSTAGAMARPTPSIGPGSAAPPEPSEPKSPRRASLSDQNDKFERAIQARQNEDLATALRLYREFVQEFPASPLAQNARVEVMRLLLQSNKSAAAQAARDYLQRYPAGFAREEAKRILAAP